MCLNNRPLKLQSTQNNHSNEAWTRYIKYFYFTIIWVISITKKLNIFFFSIIFKNKISSVNKGSTKIRHAMIHFLKVELKFYHFLNYLKSYFRFHLFSHLFEIKAFVTLSTFWSQLGNVPTLKHLSWKDSPFNLFICYKLNVTFMRVYTVLRIPSTQTVPNHF